MHTKRASTGDDEPDGAQPAGSARKDDGTQRFLEAFVELYAEKRHGARYFVTWGKHKKMLRPLLAHFGHERLILHAKILLATNDPWIEGTDRGIETLVARINWCEDRLAAWEARQKR